MPVYKFSSTYLTLVGPSIGADLFLRRALEAVKTVWENVG
jgi:hypothetical protein